MGAMFRSNIKLLLFGICLLTDTCLFTAFPTVMGIEDLPKKGERNDVVIVQKCCEQHELMVDSQCVHGNETDTGLWSPMFTGEDGQSNVQLPGPTLVIGIPQCPRQLWSIYFYSDSHDRLVLLPNGVLRHYVTHPDGVEVIQENDLLQEHQNEEGDTQWHHDYQQGSYCLDKVILTYGQQEAQIAIVCVPDIGAGKTDFTHHLMQRILNPICHGLAIICYLIIAVVYFVMPQLRDLVGNILTSISLCLITSQAADLVRIFTGFTSHVSFLVADIVMYVSLMAAFFWLNSLGYYIWKTFRSRNVFLRVTDGRKYCYYSCYALGATFMMASIAIFAHFTLENSSKSSSPSTQTSIGWLGKAVFFTPVAFTVLVDIFFYLTTGHTISQMSTYGRIHHKMKYSFELFVKLFLVMAIDWLFLLLSWLPYPVLMYCHIVMNALLALAFLYICILSQRQVTLLLRQACCCCQPSEPVNTVEWGEEMSCNVSKSHSAFKILLTAHPMTQHVIPEDLNFLNHTTTML